MSTSTPEQPHINKPVYSEEIDLFELVQSLWQEKILIIIITAVFTALTVIYALTATPIYQAHSSLISPPAAAIQGYNQGRIEAFRNVNKKDDKDTEYSMAKALTVDDVYKTFKKNLTSLRLRTAFFEEVYLPSLTVEEQKRNRDALLKRFNQVLIVKQGAANTNPELYTVTVELNDPVAAAEWVQDYIERAIAATKLELRNTIEAEQKVRVNALSIQKKALLDTAKQEREDQVKLLKEALYIAESIDLEGASPLSDKASLGGNRYIDNDLIYTRGAKTLRAQLAVLEKRSNDEAFINGFRELNTQLEILQNYTLDDSNVAVVDIDEAAEVPATPIKPNKKLIVAVGVVLGGMLGVFAALIRSMIRRRKSVSAQ